MEGEQGIAQALERLNQRLDRLEQKVDALSGLAHLTSKIPLVADAAGTTVQFVTDELQKDGVDPIALGLSGIEVARKAARPEAVAALSRLLDRTSDLTFALDTVEKLDAKMKESGIDREAVTGRGLGLALRLAKRMDDAELALDTLDRIDGKLAETKTAKATLAAQAVDLLGAFVKVSPEAMTIAKDGALEPSTLQLVRHAAQAVVDVRKQPVAPVGLWGAMRQMGDPDVQRAVGFTLQVARRFGELLGR